MSEKYSISDLSRENEAPSFMQQASSLIAEYSLLFAQEKSAEPVARGARNLPPVDIFDAWEERARNEEENRKRIWNNLNSLDASDASRLRKIFDLPEVDLKICLILGNETQRFQFKDGSEIEIKPGESIRVITPDKFELKLNRAFNIEELTWPDGRKLKPQELTISVPQSDGSTMMYKNNGTSWIGPDGRESIPTLINQPFKNEDYEELFSRLPGEKKR